MAAPFDGDGPGLQQTGQGRVKRGKMLGGHTPLRGSRLVRQNLDRSRPGSRQILGILIIGCLIVGMVGGFAYALDRQLRGGILQQRETAMQRPDWIALENLPGYVGQAFVVAVDPGFEEAGSLRTHDERATTIPRELVRQIHLLGGSFGADARELLMAPLLDQRTSKDQLLELYLNRVYLGVATGYPVYGVHYAAEEFLDKPASELTLSEAATLAGLLLEPRIENPQERAGAVGARRNEILAAMLREGYIDEGQYTDAISETLAFQPGSGPAPMSRRIPPRDAEVMRLPPEYRPQPDSIAAD